MTSTKLDNLFNVISRITICYKVGHSAELVCPKCGYKGALILKEREKESKLKMTYNEVRCNLCGQIYYKQRNDS
ncbi:hypothetical protein MCGE09_00303 [Thaumarchaeota archaeon SCGC AB-539-E09]|nr:hypothetical protein MCGE09_00303 [Thaumarchaeota archaeon SCGC AB-539-E09]